MTPDPRHLTSPQFCFTYCQTVSLSFWLYGLITWRLPHRHLSPVSRGEYGNANTTVITLPRERRSSIHYVFCFLKNTGSVQSSSESNHTECSVVIPVSSSIIFWVSPPQNGKKSGSTQTSNIEILLKKKVEWNEVENEVFLV